MIKKVDVKVNRLGIGEQLDESFDCGKSYFNEMIKESYFANLCRQLYIYEIKIEDKLYGYIACSIAKYDKKYFEVIEKDNNYRLPGIIYLEYIAIVKEYQRKGIGTVALNRFIYYIRKLSENIPIGMIALSPIEDREKWYNEEFGFEFLSEKINDDKIMYIDLKTEEECKLIQKSIKQ